MFEHSNTVTLHNTGWQSIPNVNITTAIKEFKRQFILECSLSHLKIMAFSPGWLTVNNTEKSVTVNIDKTTNDAKYHS